jgi:hypothetical protein
LKELLLNAIEHGNLGITYSEKDGLDMEDLEVEVSRRLTLPEYREKRATINYSSDAEKVSFLIKDQGNGFDWQPYMQFDPERVFDTHGRGIAMANTSYFDKVEYHGNGNEVMAVVYLGSDRK